jgi:hypothetical protein
VGQLCKTFSLRPSLSYGLAWHEGVVYSLLYAGVLTPPLTQFAGSPRPGALPPILGGACGAHFLNPGCMDLGPNYRFEIRQCPSRLGNTWRWLVFKDRTLIATGIVHGCR